MKTTEITAGFAAMTVNEIVRKYPATIAVFNEFGIDSCCGGGVELSVAAERDSVEMAVLIDRLNRAIENA